MRTISLVAALVLAGSAAAQTPMPLPAFGSTFTSTLTRGFWFQAPVGFTITGLQVPNEGLQAFQVVEVINLGAAAPPAYPGTVTGTQLFYNNSTPTGTTISCAIPIAAGDFIGILGACTSSVGNATSYNSYAATTGAFASTVLGMPVSLTRFGTQSGIASNNGNQPCWQEPAGSLSRVEVYVAPAGPGFAQATNYGTGCVAQAASLYEHFLTTPSIDLSNTAFSMLNTGTGYVVLPSTTAFVPPSATAQNLNLGDDTEASVTLSTAFSYPGGSTTSLNVCSNGHISVASNGAAGDYTPTPFEMLGWANATWAVWRDMICNTTGNVFFEEVAGVAYITWNGVIGYVGTAAGTTPSTFQLQFHLATGNVEFVFQSMDTVSISGWAGGEGWVVGYSPGGPSLDSGNVDLTTALPITLPGADTSALQLNSSARPITTTTIQLVTANIPAGAPFGAILLGFQQFNPGLDLTGIGMAGCRQYNDGAVTLLFLPGGNATNSLPFAVPNAVGIQVEAQSVVYAPASGLTALGAIASNGVALLIGNL